jgi:divinyl chlorophyllide a 8-vinyl-reductase
LTKPIRIFMLGSTGTIGMATRQALVERGFDVVCFVRPGTPPAGGELRCGDVTSARSIAEDGFRGERFDVLLSCLASRTGIAEDAWAIDYRAHLDALAAARSAGVRHVVLLSAICVQKPRLAFQHAKLAFEQALIESGMTYSIVRPTAFFKSLSGQVERLRQGKPYLMFGDGTLTACKPISNRDVAAYLVRCIEDETLHNRILPIGGPGDALTPRQQGEMLFELLQQEPRFRQVPVGVLGIAIGLLNAAGLVFPAAARKAELARIGRYYATESMLVYDPRTRRYDAAATPATGSDTLRDHYRRMIAGELADDRGAHAVF